MIELMPFPVACEGLHRTGWPYVFEGLRSLADPEPNPQNLLFDDFVDRTILYPPPTTEDFSRRPWVGIFHGTPRTPFFWPTDRSTLGILVNKAFIERRRFLKGVITLNSPLTAFLATKLRVPIITLKYPTAVPPEDAQWSPEAYFRDPTVIHVGWYLRNQDIIDQVTLPAGVRRLRVKHLSVHDISALGWMRKRTRAPWARPVVEEAPIIGPLPDHLYDELLTKSVILAEFMTCAASTTIVEAIARCTPIVVNRLPAIEEYLGKDYPLFYKNIKEIPALLSAEKVLAAHNHMRQMDRTWLSRDCFVEQVGAFCKKVYPAPAAR